MRLPASRLLAAAEHAPEGGANLRELIAIMNRRRRGIMRRRAWCRWPSAWPTWW